MSLNQRTIRFSAALMIFAVSIGAVSGALVSYAIVSRQINNLQNQVSTLQVQLTDRTYTQDIYLSPENVSLAKLYEEIKYSVVTIRGIMEQTSFIGSYFAEVQGSGFVYNFTGQMREGE